MSQPNRIEQSFGVAALAGLVIACLVIVRPFLVPLLWAIIIVITTWQLKQGLQRRLGRSRSAAAALMTILMGLVFLVPLATVGVSLADSARHLIATARHSLEVGLGPPPAWLGAIPLAGEELVARWNSLASGETQIATAIKPHLALFGDWLVATGEAIGRGTIELLLSLVIAFFFYRDGDIAAARFMTLTRRLAGDRAQHLVAVAGGTIRGVVHGIVGTNLIEAVLATIGFRLAGVPGSFVLGLICFFLTTIPFMPILVWVPATLWIFHAGTPLAGALLGIWSFIVFGPLEHVLRPYLISRGSSLPLILVLLGMLGGLAEFGFLGIFLGPTLLAVGYALLDQWSAPRPVPPDTP